MNIQRNILTITNILLANVKVSSYAPSDIREALDQNGDPDVEYSSELETKIPPCKLPSRMIVERHLRNSYVI